MPGAYLEVPGRFRSRSHPRSDGAAHLEDWQASKGICKHVTRGYQSHVDDGQRPALCERLSSEPDVLTDSIVTLRECVQMNNKPGAAVTHLARRLIGTCLAWGQQSLWLGDGRLAAIIAGLPRRPVLKAIAGCPLPAGDFDWARARAGSLEERKRRPRFFARSTKAPVTLLSTQEELRRESGGTQPSSGCIGYCQVVKPNFTQGLELEDSDDQ
jgi:hypothetical protein